MLSTITYLVTFLVFLEVGQEESYIHLTEEPTCEFDFQNNKIRCAELGEGFCSESGKRQSKLIADSQQFGQCSQHFAPLIDSLFCNSSLQGAISTSRAISETEIQAKGADPESIKYIELQNLLSLHLPADADYSVKESKAATLISFNSSQKRVAVMNDNNYGANEQVYELLNLFLDKKYIDLKKRDLFEFSVFLYQQPYDFNLYEITCSEAFVYNQLIELHRVWNFMLDSHQIIIDRNRRMILSISKNIQVLSYFPTESLKFDIIFTGFDSIEEVKNMAVGIAYKKNSQN